MKKKWLMIICVLMVTVVLTGCGANDINTDEEFHASVDKAIEQSWRGGDVDAIFEELYNQYSSRYSVNQMDDYLQQRVEEIEEELFSKLYELDNKSEALKVESEDLLAQLENKADYDTYMTIYETFEKKAERMSVLDDEYQKTTDLYRMIEILEEIVELLQEIVTTLEEALK
ncbi:hypothetical protein [Candidatus Contubernalis alkaliaceticus]|uniref:hypothetical protein n=1 Tax=Candidatus Contubernalis alkaliaceticus TaxID=338645 RepID=UPI001F4C4630|nr:hypothetical protein [Candidatus Contubernalis alkalaceticus]UNC92421.1 hypothetical protein HUE98_10100 [Candidatus Contubernalis alkalaceticus]